MLIAERVKSLKSIIVIPRTEVLLTNGDTNQPLVNARTFDDLRSYQFHIGSTNYPPAPVQVSVQNPGESYSELLKAFGMSLHSVNNNETNIDMHSYTLGAYTGYIPASIAGAPFIGEVLTPENGPRLSKFMIGIDLDNFNNLSALQSGLDVSSLALPIRLTCNRGGVDRVRLDAFTFFDQVLTIGYGGQVSVTR
jgi:hypothetical protein